MKQEDFDYILEHQISAMRNTLAAKGREYGTSDRLSNFKTGASMSRETPKQVLGGYLLKHLVSIYDLINEEVPGDLDVWTEKINDSINYLVLLKALVVEEVTDDQDKIDFNEVAYLNKTPEEN